jgi:two-component system chemotaxis response regulator CheB
LPTSTHQHDVIVIGASLGGMEALKKLFAQLPHDLPAAVLVVWHMSPEALNLLPDILRRVTDFPVVSAEDCETIMPGRAYIAPPDFHLVVEADETDSKSTRLTRGPKENRFRPSIDVLFRSAALAFGPRVIGVILTGMLDDGASGLYAIKERGGLAVVQDPVDAEAPNMPINAMRAVKVDHVSPIAGMGELLVQLINQPVKEGEDAVGENESSPNLQTEIRIALEDNSLERGALGLGEPTSYTCPECHGALSQITEGNIIRFRCHTGHAFTLDSLLAEVTESSEAALWNAIRVLQENEMITGHLAKQLSEGGDDEAAQACLQKMVRAMRQANLVRQATAQDDSPNNAEYQRRP